MPDNGTVGRRSYKKSNTVRCGETLTGEGLSFWIFNHTDDLISQFSTKTRRRGKAIKERSQAIEKALSFLIATTSQVLIY